MLPWPSTQMGKFQDLECLLVTLIELSTAVLLLSHVSLSNSSLTYVSMKSDGGVDWLHAQICLESQALMHWHIGQLVPLWMPLLR